MVCQDRSSSVKSISLLVPDEGAIISEAIRGNQWPSEGTQVIRSHMVPVVRRMPRLAGWLPAPREITPPEITPPEITPPEITRMPRLAGRLPAPHSTRSAFRSVGEITPPAELTPEITPEITPEGDITLEIGSSCGGTRAPKRR